MKRLEAQKHSAQHQQTSEHQRVEVRCFRRRHRLNERQTQLRTATQQQQALEQRLVDARAALKLHELQAHTLSTEKAATEAKLARTVARLQDARQHAAATAQAVLALHQVPAYSVPAPTAAQGDAFGAPLDAAMTRLAQFCRRLQQLQDTVALAAVDVRRSQVRLRNQHAALEADKRVWVKRLQKRPREASAKPSRGVRLQEGVEAVLRAAFRRLDPYETGLVLATRFVKALERDVCVRNAVGGPAALEQLVRQIDESLRELYPAQWATVHWTWGEFLLVFLPDLSETTAVPPVPTDATDVPVAFDCDASSVAARAPAVDLSSWPREALEAHIRQLQRDRAFLVARVQEDAQELQARVVKVQCQWQAKTDDLTHALAALKDAARDHDTARVFQTNELAHLKEELAKLKTQHATALQAAEDAAAAHRQELERRLSEKDAQLRGLHNDHVVEVQDLLEQVRAVQNANAKQELHIRQLERQWARAQETADVAESAKVESLTRKLEKRDTELMKVRRERNALLAALRDQTGAAIVASLHFLGGMATERKVIPLRDVTSKYRLSMKGLLPKQAPMGRGMLLSLLYMGFATVVAVSTYYLNGIANTPVFFGVVMEAFTYNQWNVPVNALLQGDGFVHTTYPSPPVDGSVSVSDLLYKTCAVNDQGCAATFLGDSNQIWSAVGKAFALIPNFDQPLFQDPAQTVRFKHINNLSGWNKAVVQFYIDGHDMAITCMVRRTSFYLTQAQPSTAIVDSLAYCSQRKYDPKWMCENEVDLTVNTYAIQVNKGVASYIGVCKRGAIYLNAGHTAVVTGGLGGSTFVRTVPAIDEYMGGIVQASAPWDVLGVSQCYDYDFSTNLGWLLQIQGVVTMVWQCDSLMLTNSVVLWCMIVYLVVLQAFFLRHSAVSYVPVHMSKTVVGLVILGVAFYGNENLQTLTTFLIQNPVGGFPSMFYALCGPAQVASIVGIMTGTMIQIWFTPRIVTQTWLVMLFSVINWILVFFLEGFVFPYQNQNLPSVCGLTTSTSCFVFDAIPHTYYLSAITSAVVVVVAIVVIHVHGQRARSPVAILKTNSVLKYLRIPDFTSIATTIQGCVIIDSDGAPAIDSGILLMKNMLHVSDSVLTRTSNVQYELLFRFTPPFLRRFFGETVGSILVYEVKDRKITREFDHKMLHEMDIGHMKNVTGYLS
ncbi:hypothetical protein ACHHYP_03533 [Achlya hypogyna]|uniref:Uncharacterized protein n=1 Tax=Achlya hypogyna TaxID=1202772 RepID=A0A1V9Z3L8_ACHHY|nr:hypothetical protein ACHHYP_03533 [Achlya hypogyna]